MNLEQTKKMIENVIENEFFHVNNNDEVEDLRSNSEIVRDNEKRGELLKQLMDINQELAQEYSDAECNYWVNVAKYYFKMGVKAGTTNLNFLKDTGVMDII